MKKIILSSIGFLFMLSGFAQSVGDMYVPLYSNYQLKQYLLAKHNAPVIQMKTGTKDTLSLPFFDDFARLGVIPLDTLWSDAAVFINADFAINPPSIGVATFDGLDAQGNAYEDINVNVFGPADTLTSQPINLSSFVPGDSLYLSFFYQAQGISFETLKSSDSLVLQFKNKIGAWVNVWSSPGIAQQAFKPACIGIKDISYMHGGFRFRWINYQQYIGNLKQWHLDYVYLNQGRNANDTVFQDQAMVYLPDFPFKTYSHLPWKHLQQNFSKHLRSGYDVPVNNLSTSGETFSVSLRLNDLNDVLGNAVLNGQSLPPNGITSFVLNPNPNMFLNTRDSNQIRLVARLGDILGGNDVKQNDSAVRYVELANYFAYDDGTAESGYGIRNSSGSVACGFELEYGDSIRGVWVHFTQAEAKVTTGFSLNVWQDIQSNTLLYSKEAGKPVYTDSINGFNLYLLDSAVFVTGKFFVGWTQNSSFLLNVGLDRNYRFNGLEVPNPNMFYNVNGQWRPSSVKGTIMMRPVVGEQWPDPASVNPIPAPIILSLYPNPASSAFYIETDEQISILSLFDMSGVPVKSWKSPLSKYDISEIRSGIYLIRIELLTGQILSRKLIISK